MKVQIQGLLNIYKGVKNNVGDPHYSFSVNWLRNRSKKSIKSIAKSAENLIKQNYKTTSADNAYTTFKEFKFGLKGKGFTKGFISVNERATNKYADKKTMFYFANRFLNPSFKDYFMSGGIRVDEDQWALAELIQWIWRGSIRKNHKMNLFIPSKRMRDLLTDWLEDNGVSSTMKKAA